MLSFARSVIALLVGCVVANAAAAQTPATPESQALQRRQLKDTLRLQNQQAFPPRATLSPSDARKLDELQLRQRLDQQRLEGDQALLDQQRARNPNDRALDTQQRLLDQERQLQIQRFQIEQNALLRTMKPRPLQRPLPDGRLHP